MRHTRRLVASVVLLAAALFLGAGTASADSVWQVAPHAAAAMAPADSVWE